MKKFFGYGMMASGMGADYGMASFIHWIFSIGVLVWMIVGLLLIIYLWKLIMKR